MAAKLIILILALALLGSAVLVIRQQRLLVYSEMTQTIRAGRDLDRQIYDERLRVASALHPERIELAAARLGPLKPLPMLWCVPALPLEPEAHPELIRDPAQLQPLLSALEWERERLATDGRLEDDDAL